MKFYLFISVALSIIIYPDRFVAGSSSLAKKLGIPSLIIGLTIVAFGTSGPELSVSVIAGINGSNEIALGNVLGSNIFNLLFILGVCTIVAPLTVDKVLLRRDWFACIIITALLFVFMAIGKDISRIESVDLLLLFSVIMYLQIRSAKKDKMVEEDCKTETQKPIKIIFNILFGLISIIIGGQISVYGASEIARTLGLSETLIGLTIVAIGTSLPELVTSVIATKKGDLGIAVGNVIGSNIFNTLFILGISSLLNPIPIQVTAFYDTLILFAITLVIFILAKKKRLNRTSGIAFVSTYILYTIWLIIR